MIIQRTTVETFDGAGNLMHSQVTTIEEGTPEELDGCGCNCNCSCEDEVLTCPACGCEVDVVDAECVACGEDDVCEASDYIEDAIASLQQAADILSGRLCQD